LRGKQHYALQVSGDSMNPSLQDGDFVICGMMDKGEWEYIQDGDVCVINSDSRGLQIKRLKNRLREGYLICQSDNRNHPTFNLVDKDIIEIWRVSWKLSSHLADDGSINKKISDLEERLNRMEMMA
jgi:phage repressor protein C with HTH and peptisase S24 domain